MATVKMYVAQDATSRDVTLAAGSAITGGVAEFTVDLAVSTSKKDALLALDNIRRRILEDDTTFSTA